MNYRYSLRGIALAALFILSAMAQASEAVRPKIGLVLGGGGARGAAHIGVLEVLEKLRVPVDCVSGTSMGALVAGAYAAGLSPAEMRTELAKADWNDMFLDNPLYSEINYRNKVISTRFMPGSESGVGKNGVTYQGGVVSGQKIKLFFNRLVHSDRGERNIESLPLPLSIIATDIGNGDKIVFRDGSLTKAMRASMSVPGLLAPIDHMGHKLVDGGLVDNVPIDEARGRCKADMVIAVNVGSPLLKGEDVGSLLTVAVQMVNILTEQNVTRSLATLKPTDVYIKPDLEGITASDFHKSSETADRGKVAAEALAERLKAFSVDEKTYAAWRGKIAYDPAKHPSPSIDEIQIAEMEVANPAAVERHLRVKPGDTLNDGKIDQDLLQAYGDGWYESVDYSLLRERDRNILHVSPIEKRWGPDYLRFGVNLETNFQQDSSYAIRAAYDKTWLNDLGGELLLIGQLGSSSIVGADLYQPLEAQQRYFLEASAYYSTSNLGVYQNNHKLADYAKDKGTVSMGLGYNVGLLGQVRAGWRQTWLNTDLSTGVPTESFPNKSSESFGAAYAGLDFDQMDRLYFPTSGWSSRVGYSYSPAENYSKLIANFVVAHSFGDYVINSKLSYQGSPSGKLPAYDAGTLGGFINLSGYTANQLVGDNITYGNVRVEKIIGHMPMGLRGDMRLGVALEAGKVGNPYTETELNGWITSGAVYVGGETPLGPVYLGYGRSDQGASSLYLFLGTP